MSPLLILSLSFIGLKSIYTLISQLGTDTVWNSHTCSKPRASVSQRRHHFLFRVLPYVWVVSPQTSWGNLSFCKHLNTSCLLWRDWRSCTLRIVHHRVNLTFPRYHHGGFNRGANHSVFWFYVCLLALHCALNSSSCACKHRSKGLSKSFSLLS